ncbi:MAG: Synerg-CTERM sorting domain-containing protein [Synergistaceae bacterium]|nr:Synerg-CTERM sorting domain-containing protein [Synergistaceae bacterium]
MVQTEANSVSGTVVMTWNGNTASGTVSATRSTDSGGGGCNAGLAGLALLALAPLFYRKKK